jgi:hypothetical protein
MSQNSFQPVSQEPQPNQSPYDGGIPRYGAQPYGGQSYSAQSYSEQPYGDFSYDDAQDGPPFFFPDLEGEAFKSKATMFALIGIFFFGVVFGPLAIVNAGRAEALGVRATFGKVVGWLVAVLHGLSLFFYVPLIAAGIVAAINGY